MQNFRLTVLLENIFLNFTSVAFSRFIWVIKIALIQFAFFSSWKKVFVLFRVISFLVIFSAAADFIRFRSVSFSRTKFDAIVVNRHVFFYAKFPLDRFVREFFSGFTSLTFSRFTS